jgi:hypothetical protein
MNTTTYGDGQAQRESQVTQKLGALGASMELIEKDLRLLEERLARVLRPDEHKPAPPVRDQETKENLVVVAMELQSRIAHAEHLRSIIHSIMERLEA